MNEINKPKTSLTKFEEFFSTNYKDEVFEVLENYPIERTLIVDFNDLEMFDPDLADLLIEKPEEVIAASQKAIKNIDPLMKNAEINIRFKNLTNEVPLESLSSRYIGKFVKVKGIISDLTKVKSRIETGVFECRGCMRLNEVEQSSSKTLYEPSLCVECGGRDFRLLQEESKYIDIQEGTIKNILINPSLRDEVKSLDIVLEDDLVDHLRDRDIVYLTGTLKVFNKSNIFSFYFNVNNIEFINKYEDSDLDEISLDDDSVSRSSIEYTTWKKEVLQRDNYQCQCCGLDKRLNVHHINGYKEYPELRTDVGNGIVLCQFCHDKYHSVYGLKEINSANFTKFMRRFSNGKS